MTSLTSDASRVIGASLREGDLVVVTTLDHDANVAPWRRMAAERGARLMQIDVDPDSGRLDPVGFQRALNERPRLVAFGFASNVIGTVNPVADMVNEARRAGALTFVDAVHWAPHGPIDVEQLGVDFLVCSVYTFFGPHLGVLYARADSVGALVEYGPADAAFEKGTPNFEAIAGAGASLAYLASIGIRYGDRSDSGSRVGPSGTRRDLHAAMLAVRSYEMGLYRRLAGSLERTPGIQILGITEPANYGDRTPTAALRLDNLSPRVAAEHLAARDVRAGHGNFYAPALIDRLGLLALGGCSVLASAITRQTRK